MVVTAWIESHQSLSRHRKTIKASGYLGISRQTLIGHLFELWWWGIDNVAVDGVLPDMNNYDIATAALWDGNPEEFATALIQAGFIDKVGNNLILHDWYEYAGKLIEKRQKDTERKREYKSNGIPTEIPRKSDGIPAEVAGTVHYSTLQYTTSKKEEERELALPPTSTEERETLNIFLSIPGYPSDFIKDLNHIRELSREFPTVNILEEAKNIRTWLKDKPLKKNSNPRLTFRNWVRIASKKGGQANGTPLVNRQENRTESKYPMRDKYADPTGVPV